jgi:hypothetical protein
MERRDHCQSALNGERIISARMLVWCTAEVVACGGNVGMKDQGMVVNALGVGG